MSVPTELLYTAEHEWLRVDGDSATIGITDHAASALGDVVYVDLPSVGSAVTAGEPCGEVESTSRSATCTRRSPARSPRVNEAPADDPSAVNADPYGAGWMFTVAVTATPARPWTPAAYPP